MRRQRFSTDLEEVKVSHEYSGSKDKRQRKSQCKGFVQGVPDPFRSARRPLRLQQEILVLALGVTGSTRV